MPGTAPSQATIVDIPAALGAAEAAEVHATLLVALDLAGADAAPVTIRLDGVQGACAPLALQILESARRSFPAGTLTLDESVSEALASLTHSKDS